MNRITIITADLVITPVSDKNFELLDTVLRTRVDYDKSAGAGKSVIEYKKESKLLMRLKN